MPLVSSPYRPHREFLTSDISPRMLPLMLMTFFLFPCPPLLLLILLPVLPPSDRQQWEDKFPPIPQPHRYDFLQQHPQFGKTIRDREELTFENTAFRCILQCTRSPFLSSFRRIGNEFCTFYHPRLLPFQGAAACSIVTHSAVVDCFELPSWPLLVVIVVAEYNHYLLNLLRSRRLYC